MITIKLRDKVELRNCSVTDVMRSHNIKTWCYFSLSEKLSHEEEAYLKQHTFVTYNTNNNNNDKNIVCSMFMNDSKR